MGKARPHSPVLGRGSVAAACLGGLVLKGSRPCLSPEPLLSLYKAGGNAWGNVALDERSKSLDLLMWSTKNAGNNLIF